jgi:hypothetical protein
MEEKPTQQFKTQVTVLKMKIMYLITPHTKVLATA